MIVFVDLRESISTGKGGIFAFLDTHKDKFITLSDTQVFDSVQDLKDSYESNEVELSDLINLIPKASVWIIE